MSEPLSALIVGCGAIAGGHDEGHGGDAVLTHAGAYTRHPGFALAACVEPDADRSGAFMARWGVDRGFADLDACRESGLTFDVASVCAPTHAHETVMRGLLDLPVRAVFAEKPLAADAEAARRLACAYEEAGRSLAVNYLRRWDEGLAEVAAEVQAGEWGAVQLVVGRYGKGLLNCGSHMIDLIAACVGPVTPRAVLRAQVDHAADDPTIDAVLTTADGAPVYLAGQDSRRFFIFELDIMLAEGRIVIEDLGARVRRRRVHAHPLFPGYRGLAPGAWSETGLDAAMLSAVDNLHAHLTSGARLLCDGHLAVQTEETCAALLRMTKDLDSRAAGAGQ